MKIKKDDNVIVITGKDKGKTGVVVRAFPREDRVIINGINIKKVHERARKQGTKGKIVEKAFPMHVSNVRKVDGENAKPAKVKAAKKTSAKKAKAE